MALRINNNATSLATYGSINTTSMRMEKSIAKLSSGLRINTAADDAAGLAISEKMRSQIRGLNRARLNAQDGVSMLQTAEGGLNETESIIQRMRELAIQGSNDTLTSNDRLEIQKEINQLRDAIDDISNTTEYNTKKLLNGSQTAQISSSSQFVRGMVTGNVNAHGDFNVDMKVLRGGISQMQTSQMFTDKNTGELAKGSTKLEDIAQFYDENGVFALSSAQKLTVTGNTKTAEFTVDGKMSLNDLAASLQSAISGSSNLGIRNSQVQVVSTAQSGVSGIGGYLQLTSGAIGDDGKFSVAGNQKVIDALGLSVSRESDNNLVQVKIQGTDGSVKTVNTSSDRASGLLDGMDIQFKSTAAQIAGNGGVVDGLRFDTAAAFKISAGDGVVSVTFAAGSTYSMEGIAKQINAAIKDAATKGTGDINKAVAAKGLEATVVDGQIRISSKPTDANASTDFKISDGSSSIGLAAGTFTGFVDGDKDTSKSIKGISMLGENDIAAADNKITVSDGGGDTVDLTIGDVKADIADLANGDLYEINKLVTSVNKALAVANVDARMDAVNGSIAFTSTILGNLNTNGGPTSGDITVSAADPFFNNTLGFDNGTAKGTGDTNFKLHLLDKSSQFQIGANAGQRMKISIGDMSAAALGIDNIDMSTTQGAQSAIEKLDQALSMVSAERSKLGAYSNRLNYTMNNLQNTTTNLTDAESRIRDVDMANEMINFTSSQIMQQAGTAMLAQANALPRTVLSLLG